jgi:NAD(P)-dependent dehydrogenase (short-subunit alcohol dehydrogenase family)
VTATGGSAITTRTLTGSNALITGSSRGIGRAIATQLARDGADIVVNYRDDEAAARDTADSIEALGRRAVYIRADVTIAAEADGLIAAATASLGQIDILVNNVGTFALGSISATSLDDWQRTLDSNLTSVYYLCRSVLPGMRQTRHGRIVNVGLGPVHLVRGAPNIAAYAIAKTGVAILTRSLAIEEAANGIAVNCVSPGLIDSGHLPREQRVWMETRVPMGRLGRPDEVADAVAFLASERASYISGANLAVGGAWDWEDRMTNHDHIVADLFTRERHKVGGDSE